MLGKGLDRRVQILFDDLDHACDVDVPISLTNFKIRKEKMVPRMPGQGQRTDKPKEASVPPSKPEAT